MPSSTEVLFCYDVARIDEWATRTGIPLTSAEALGTNYRRARDWMLALKNELVAQYGWRETQQADPKLLFDIQLPYPGQPHRPPLRIYLPAHATTFFAPDRRVAWEMVFHNYAFIVTFYLVCSTAELRPTDVYNKIDSISLEQVDKLARQDHTVVISCELGLNLDYLLERIWEELGLVKVYTKKRGAHPDLTDPICLRKGATIEGVCQGIHRSLAANFRYALGKSSKFAPHAQKVGLNHQVADDDVVSIFTK